MALDLRGMGRMVTESIGSSVFWDKKMDKPLIVFRLYFFVILEET